MKTNKLLKTFIGASALAFALSINFKYAINNYGILDNTLVVTVLASGSTGGVSSPEEKRYDVFDPYAGSSCSVTHNGFEYIGFKPMCIMGSDHILCPACTTILKIPESWW